MNKAADSFSIKKPIERKRRFNTEYNMISIANVQKFKFCGSNITIIITVQGQDIFSTIG